MAWKPAAVKPISNNALKACAKWAECTRDHKEFDLKNLEAMFHGSPGIEKVELRIDDDGSQYFALTMNGRTERLFDAPALIMLRLLTASVGSFNINAATGKTNQKFQHYFKVTIPRRWAAKPLSLTAQRIVSGATGSSEGDQAGREPTSHYARGTHFDIRRRNLREPLRKPDSAVRQHRKYGRVDALSAAPKNFASRRMKLKFTISTKQFENALMTSAAETDKLPMIKRDRIASQ